jgi:hypothetical protein
MIGAAILRADLPRKSPCKRRNSRPNGLTTVIRSKPEEGFSNQEVVLPYLNCPECFYRVRSDVAGELDGEMSCPRCSRRNRAVAMYSTALALNPRRTVYAAPDGSDPARPERLHSPRVA